MSTNSKCFQTYSDDCIDYTGLSELNLGIEQGDSLKEVLEKLIQAVKSNQDNIKDCSFCNGDSAPISACDSDIENTTKIKSGGNSVSSTPTNNPYTLKSVASDNSVSVTYDLMDAIPSDARVVSNRVVVDGQKNGYAGRVAESNALRGGFTIMPSNFPARVEVETRIQTDKGEQILRSTQPIDSTGQESKPFLNSTLPNGTVANTQSDVNEILDGEVVKLQNQVDGLNNISVSGLQGATPNEVVNNLYSELVSLREEVNQLKT